MSRTAGAPSPASLMSSPVLVVALIVLVANDRWWKAAAPSAFTGKASDVAGLILAPVLIVSLAELAAWAMGRPLPDRSRCMGVSAAVVGLSFAAVQIWPTATHLYAVAAGHTFRMAASVTPGMSGSGGLAAVTPDVTDLVALVALVIPLHLTRAISPAGT